MPEGLKFDQLHNGMHSPSHHVRLSKGKLTASLCVKRVVVPRKTKESGLLLVIKNSSILLFPSFKKLINSKPILIKLRNDHTVRIFYYLSHIYWRVYVLFAQ